MKPYVCIYFCYQRWYTCIHWLARKINSSFKIVWLFAKVHHKKLYIKKRWMNHYRWWRIVRTWQIWSFFTFHLFSETLYFIRTLIIAAKIPTNLTSLYHQSTWNIRYGDWSSPKDLQAFRRICIRTISAYVRPHWK